MLTLIYSCENNDANSECVSCQIKEFKSKKVAFQNQLLNLKSYSEDVTTASKFMYTDLKDFSVFNTIINEFFISDIAINDLKAVILFVPNDHYSSKETFNFEDLNIENILFYLEDGKKLKTMFYSKTEDGFKLNKELSNLQTYKFRTDDIFAIKDMFHFNEVFRVISFIDFSGLPKKGKTNLSFQKSINSLKQKYRVSDSMLRGGGCESPCSPMEKLSCTYGS